MGVTAAIAAGTMLVGAGTTAVMANQQNQEAKGLMYDQQQSEKQAVDQYNQEQYNQQQTKISESLRANAESAQTWRNMMGGTILTGPRGVPTQSQSGRKTLLGM